MNIKQSVAGLIIALMMTPVVNVHSALAGPADLIATANNRSKEAVDHSAWSKLLGTYVKPGAGGLNRVDYAAFKRGGRSALKQYIKKMQMIDPQRLNRNEQFAFLANLYNAKTIDIVLDHYPVKSIKDISLGGGLFGAFTAGPWKAKVLRINGVALSLNDIEHGILRAVFKDPRVHYAVNCASIGCPNLGTKAWTGKGLSDQLDAAARAYINHPRGARVTGKGLVVSSIYSWFKADFGGSDKGVIAHLKRYASPKLAKKLAKVSSIYSYAYDWRLNE